jgi:hypothetical protein
MALTGICGACEAFVPHRQECSALDRLEQVAAYEQY